MTGRRVGVLSPAGGGRAGRVVPGAVSASKCCSPPAAGCRQWAGGLDDLAPGDGPGAG